MRARPTSRCVFRGILFWVVWVFYVGYFMLGILCWVFYVGILCWVSCLGCFMLGILFWAFYFRYLILGIIFQVSYFGYFMLGICFGGVFYRGSFLHTFFWGGKGCFYIFASFVDANVTHTRSSAEWMGISDLQTDRVHLSIANNNSLHHVDLWSKTGLF